MARTGRLGNISFKKESTWGTYISGDVYLRASSESLARAIDSVEDAALVGQIYTTDMIKVGDGAAGSIEGSAHGDTIGILVHGALGGESTISDPANGYIIVNYVGASAYARLSLVTTNLLAELSTDGSSWSADTNFNTSGTIDISAAGFDTLTELATAITGYTGWDATLFGLTTGVSTNIPVFAVTQVKTAGVKQGGMMLAARVSAATTAKTHTLFPVAATGSLPSYTFTVNRTLGTNESMGFVGSKIQTLAINSTAKDLVKFSAAINCKAEEITKNDISLTLPNIQAYKTANMKILVVDPTGAHTVMNEVKDFAITLNTNIDDNRVIGSLYKNEQERQGATLEISFTANNTATQYPLRTNFTNNTAVECFVYFEGETYADTTALIKYNMMFRMPSVIFTDFNSPLSTPDRLTITAAGTLVKPTSTVYPYHIYANVVDNDVTTY